MSTEYDYIASKIKSLIDCYASLRDKPDYYVFSVLCVKANFYKDPSLIFYEEDFDDIVVDGKSDGGIDILLSDPTNDRADFVIGQSKFHETISYKEVSEAMKKMADSYKDLRAGHYELFNKQVVSRFIPLNASAEADKESKIHFVFYTSAPKDKIQKKTIEKKILKEFIDYEEIDSDKIEVSILFAADILNEIKEAESTKKLWNTERF